MLDFLESVVNGAVYVFGLIGGVAILSIAIAICVITSPIWIVPYIIHKTHKRNKFKKIKENINMNNETVKRFDITIKLRGDNVYDLYMGNKWTASRGSCEGILDEARDVIRNSLLND